MGAALTVLVVVLISFVVTRVATSAFVLTGMSRESARFQARSAFLGVGFTTTEAEAVVGHPVRRRILMWLMWTGNAGIVSVVGSLVISFGGGRGSLGRLGVIVGGLVLLAVLARSAVVERALSKAIERLLDRFTELEARDYAGLLHVHGGWTIDELQVSDGDWIAGRPLAELKLKDEGVLVLGIDRAKGGYVATPRGRDVLRGGDTVIAYGRRRRIAELDDRASGEAGDRAHEAAVAEQDELEALRA